MNGVEFVRADDFLAGLHAAEERARASKSDDTAGEPARYRLLSADDLRKLPALRWRVKGLLPERGVATIFGPSTSGKSFIAIDQGAAIAEGSDWFGLRTKKAPVVYVALEGEAGIAQRVRAWEIANRRPLPDGMRVVIQPFRLIDADDVEALADVVPHGAVVYIDTTNRAAPGADENSSVDMGRILQGAKALAERIAGLVVLVHHTGKDATKGLRGHSSMHGAMDGALEVVRDGERRAWRNYKVKDGPDGDEFAFRLAVVELGEDEDGEAITSCVVRPDKREAEVRMVKLPQGGNQRLVLEAIRPLFKDGHRGKPGAPPLRPCIELETAVRVGAGALTCASDKRASRAREALTGLISRGVLGLNEGWLWLT